MYGQESHVQASYGHAGGSSETTGVDCTGVDQCMECRGGGVQESLHSCTAGGHQ